MGNETNSELKPNCHCFVKIVLSVIYTAECLRKGNITNATVKTGILHIIPDSSPQLLPLPFIPLSADRPKTSSPKFILLARVPLLITAAAATTSKPQSRARARAHARTHALSRQSHSQAILSLPADNIVSAFLSGSAGVDRGMSAPFCTLSSVKDHVSIGYYSRATDPAHASRRSRTS